MKTELFVCAVIVLSPILCVAAEEQNEAEASAEELIAQIVAGDAVENISQRRHAIAAAGPSIIPQVIAAMDEADRSGRNDLAEVLRLIGTDALPYIFEAMQNAGPLRQETYVRLLGRFGEEAADAVPLLLSILEQAVAEKRVSLPVETTRALGAIGHNGEKVTPLLLPLYDPDTPELAAAVLRSVHQLTPEAEQLRDMVVQALRSDDRALWAAGAAQAEALAPEDEEIRQLLLDELVKEESARIGLALRALLETAKVDSTVRQEFIARLESSSEQVVNMAARNLSHLTDYPDEVVPALIAALERRGNSTVAQALTSFGEHAQEAAPILTQLVKRERRRPDDFLVPLAELMPRDTEVGRLAVLRIKAESAVTHGIRAATDHLDFSQPNMLGVMTTELMDSPTPLSDEEAVAPLLEMMCNNETGRDYRQMALLWLGRHQSETALAALTEFEAWARSRYTDPPPLQIDLSMEPPNYTLRNRPGSIDHGSSHFTALQLRAQAVCTTDDGDTWALFPWHRFGQDDYWLARQMPCGGFEPPILVVLPDAWDVPHQGSHRQVRMEMSSTDGNIFTVRKGAKETTITLSEALHDSDGDGLPDLVEERLFTDPNNPDSDGDGIPDGLDGNPLTPRHEPCEECDIRQAAFLAMYGTTNSRNMLLVRRRGDAYPQEFYGYGGPVILTDEVKRGYVNVSIGIRERPAPDRAVVMVSDYVGPLAAAGYSVTLKKVGDRWVVTSCTMLYIS